MPRSLPVVNLLVTLVLLASLARVAAQPPGSAPSGPSATPGSAFTYQGELRTAAGPINGSCDFELSLWDAAEGSTQVGSSPVRQQAVALSQGRFSVQRHFGASAFDGQARYLQVAVACPAGSRSVSLCTPRQALSATPYALHAGQASSVAWSGISAVPAGFADGVDAEAAPRTGYCSRPSELGAHATQWLRRSVPFISRTPLRRRRLAAISL